MSQDVVQIFMRDGPDLREITGIGLHLPIRFNTKYYALVCVDCGRFLVNGLNSWTHLRSKHVNLHVKLSKKDYLSLVDAVIAMSLLTSPNAPALALAKCLVMEGELCTGSLNDRYLKPVQENSTWCFQMPYNKIQSKLRWPPCPCFVNKRRSIQH